MKSTLALTALLITAPLSNTWAQEKVEISVHDNGSGPQITVDRPRVELRKTNPNVLFRVVPAEWFFDATEGGIKFKSGNCDAAGCEFMLDDSMSSGKKALVFKNRFATFDKEFHYSVYLIHRDTGEKIELDPVLINKK